MGRDDIHWIAYPGPLVTPPTLSAVAQELRLEAIDYDTVSFFICHHVRFSIGYQ